MRRSDARRAQRLLESLEPGLAHDWLAFHAGYHARVRGDAQTAHRLAVRAGELGRRFGSADLEMLGLALEGATLVADALVSEGIAGWMRPPRLVWTGDIHDAKHM